jgi:hypothetical protein
MPLPPFHARQLLAALFLALPIATPAARAQTSAVVDEGTFLVSRGGTAIGRESFRIVRSPGAGGQVFLATGQSSIYGDRIVTRLGTDSTGLPVSYEADISARGERVNRLQGRGRPGRFSVLAQVKGRESARDYLLSNGALLIDQDVFHHYYFVPRLASHANVIAIIPRGNQQVTYALADRGAENLSLGGRTVQVRHYALASPSGGTQDVWIDSSGRVLKVSISERGLVALRDELPH